MSILPPQAHIIAGKIEDQLGVWNNRDLDHPHPSTAEAAGEIITLCDEMIRVFTVLREKTRNDHYDYLRALEGSPREDETWKTSESA